MTFSLPLPSSLHMLRIDCLVLSFPASRVSHISGTCLSVPSLSAERKETGNTSSFLLSRILLLKTGPRNIFAEQASKVFFITWETIRGLSPLPSLSYCSVEYKATKEDWTTKLGEKVMGYYRVWKGIFGIRDLTKIRRGNRKNDKYIDGIRDLIVPRKAGLAKNRARDAGFVFACRSGTPETVKTHRF